MNDVMKKDKKEKTNTISYFKLFRFATKWEICILITGLICKFVYYLP
jgi:hypothetical protein